MKNQQNIIDKVVKREILEQNFDSETLVKAWKMSGGNSEKVNAYYAQIRSEALENEIAEGKLSLTNNRLYLSTENVGKRYSDKLIRYDVSAKKAKTNIVSKLELLLGHIILMLGVIGATAAIKTYMGISEINITAILAAGIFCVLSLLPWMFSNIVGTHYVTNLIVLCTIMAGLSSVMGLKLLKEDPSHNKAELSEHREYPEISVILNGEEKVALEYKP